MSGNLSSGQVLPGFYSFIDFNAAGAGTEPDLAVLVFGTRKAGGSRPYNTPFKPASQADADDGCGRGSELASWFASAASQPESQGADVFLVPIAEPSGGTASTYKLRVVVPGTNPSKPGTLTLWCKSQRIAQVGFDSSDTSSTIAAAVAAQVALALDLPLGAVTVATDTLTIPYAHKGTTGEDLPFQADISPSGTGVYLAAGGLTIATNSVGAGSIRVTLGALTVSTALAGGETPAQAAALVVAAFNADTYPLFAAIDPVVATKVNLYFANGATVRRLTAAVSGSTGMTVDLGSGPTDGTGSLTSVTTNGTVGVGAPSLTGALANLDKLQAYHEWAAPWLDATTLGALATKVLGAADGSITGQKQQELTVGDYRSPATAGALPTATSPNLTTSDPRFALLRCEDAPVQGMDLAVRAAVARASSWLDASQFNWDGFQLKGNERAPILLPTSRPSETTQNTDLKTYALTPVVVGPSGNLEIVKGRTTSLATDRRLWSWSASAQAQYHAVDLPAFLRSRFRATSTVVNSEPKAPGIIDATSIENAVKERMRFWESNGNYDGADAMAPFVKATPDPLNPNRWNVKVPESPVLDLDQMVTNHSFASPSA